MLCLYLQAGSERLAVPATAVVEVIPAVRLHPLLGAPAWIAGVFRFRGTVTPVIDLARVVTGEVCPLLLCARLVIVHEPSGPDTRFIGLLAERVHELKPLLVSGPVLPTGSTHGGPDLGPLVADADGVVRIPDLGRIIPRALHEALLAPSTGARS